MIEYQWIIKKIRPFIRYYVFTVIAVAIGGLVSTLVALYYWIELSLVATFISTYIWWTPNYIFITNNYTQALNAHIISIGLTVDLLVTYIYFAVILGIIYFLWNKWIKVDIILQWWEENTIWWKSFFPIILLIVLFVCMYLFVSNIVSAQWGMIAVVVLWIIASFLVPKDKDVLEAWERGINMVLVILMCFIWMWLDISSFSSNNLSILYIAWAIVLTHLILVSFYILFFTIFWNYDRKWAETLVASASCIWWTAMAIACALVMRRIDLVPMAVIFWSIWYVIGTWGGLLYLLVVSKVM